MADSVVETPEKLTSKQIGRGVLWSYLTFVVGKLMVFISTIILARLLTPEDFGLVGLASVLAGYLGTLHTFGVGEAFIQSKFGSKASANATFILSVSSGIILFLLSVALTPAVVAFFNEARISSIFPVLAFTYVLTGFTTIHDALLVKELKFQKRLFPSLAQSVSKGIGSIVLALMGFGAWAIVWGVIIGNVVKSLVLVLVSPWRPSRVWDSKVTREIFGFGKFMVLQNILGALEENVDYLIVGKRLGATELGLYTLGYRAPELAIVSLPAVISSVAYPAYAKIQDNREALKQGVNRMFQLVAWVALPAGIGLAILSSEFILTFYTSKWEAAIPVMQLLSLYSMVYTVTYNFGDAYKAIGRPDILNKLSLSTILFTVIALWYGSQYGIIGVAWAHLLRVIVLGVVQLVLVKKILGVSVTPLLQSLTQTLICAGGMALVMEGVSFVIHSAQPVVLLLVQLIAGICSYLAFSWLVNPKISKSVLSLARQMLGGKSAGDWMTS